MAAFVNALKLIKSSSFKSTFSTVLQKNSIKFCAIHCFQVTFYRCGTKNFNLFQKYSILLSVKQNSSSWIRIMSSHPFFADYDKRGAAKCKKCKEKLEKGILRLAKMVSNPFSEEGGDMKHWFHVDCLFESFKRARATTKKISDPEDDIGGWDELEEEDKKLLRKKVKEFQESSSNTPIKKTPNKKNTKKETEKIQTSEKGNTFNASQTSVHLKQDVIASSSSKSEDSGVTLRNHKDNSFKEFRRLCANIADVSSYLSKTKIVSDFFKRGTKGDSFKGDLRIWIRLLLPGVVKRVYNLQSKQLIKLFSKLFGANQEEMLEDLEKGDVAETIRIFFEASKLFPPTKKCVLTISDVDDFLEELQGQTTEEKQLYLLKNIAERCTGNDLKMIIRLIKGDLRINAGSKHILEGLHSDAYDAFQTTRNIDTVLDQIILQKDSPTEALKIKAKLMTPVLPMLAEACRSVEQALKKCPNGMYAEIKYDGERVQVHKQGNNFKYFSRSLKPVLAHKVSHFKDFIPSAFPHGNDLILDAEVLLIDTNTSLPLPFGTLGVHKKHNFTDANVCLFVFDCIHYNGQDLMGRPIVERRKILEKNTVEIKNHIVLSEMKEVHKSSQLQQMIKSVLSQGLEGLVLKDLLSIYEPGKRHWLKVKKDYLNDGAMADSADLVVLGAWYGTGRKGGMMSIFLMGCYDPFSKKWCTVTKVHTGHDDEALERLQTELKMDKISQSHDSLPPWINCSKALTPDFVCKDPKKSAVWEITGAEFTKNTGHTANGISIRFPRVTKERSDKGWKDATDLPRLQELYEKSKEHTDVKGLQSDEETTEDMEIDSEKPTTSGSTDDAKTPKKENRIRYTKRLKTNNDQKFSPPTINPLPNIFEGLKLFISEDVKNSSDLRRYFIAYGGEIISPSDKEATYVLHTNDTKKTKGGAAEEKGRIVLPDWLWDSIKLGALQPANLYLI